MISRLAGLAGFLFLSLLVFVQGARGASPQPVEGAQGMAVSDSALASRAGAEILRQGGNAVDAAVAMGYVLAVVNPCCGNLGGGGFMTVRLADGRSTVLDFREQAPADARPDLFLDAGGRPIPQASLRGWRAVGVPGTVAGLEMARERFGSLPRERLLAPAIALARDGFTLTRADVEILAAGTQDFRRDAAAGAVFLRDGAPLEPGERLVQADLARTLAAIAAQGTDGFYAGPIAAAVAQGSAAGGGVLDAGDLTAYRARERAPVRCSYRGYEILSPPPPSSGGTALCEILNVAELYPLDRFGFNSAQAVHVMAEAMRLAFADRNALLGDPAFTDNPVARLTSKDYARALEARIDEREATPSAELDAAAPPHEGAQTTSYAVMDAAGDAVVVTTSLNAYFGARVMAPGTGVFLNDTMDDFTIAPGRPNMFGLVQGAVNAVAPGKRPLSSMAPTVVVRDGAPFLALGSPGGSRIITAVAQTIFNVVDFGMDVQAAVDAPRIHHQWLPDTLYAEPFALSAETGRDLALRGYAVETQKPWGAVEAIERPSLSAAAALPEAGDDTARGRLQPGLTYGGSDSRRPNGAAVAQ